MDFKRISKGRDYEDELLKELLNLAQQSDPISREERAVDLFVKLNAARTFSLDYSRVVDLHAEDPDFYSILDQISQRIWAEVTNEEKYDYLQDLTLNGINFGDFE